MRQHPKVLNLPFRADISRATRDNVIENYINKNEEDVCADKIWQNYFESQPDILSDEEIRNFLSNLDNVILGSDAFFPFSDNIIRAKKSGVRYIVQVGGSVNDDKVIETCNEYNMVCVFTNLRLFHH